MDNGRLEENLRKWLLEKGYPLEMRVASIFHSGGLGTIASEYYVDPSTGKSREIDIVGSVQADIEHTLLRFSFFVECKTSPEKPWVLFTRRTALSKKASVAQRAASTLGAAFLSLIADDPMVMDLPLFRVQERSAYAVTQAFRSDNDPAYVATCAAANAVAARQHAYKVNSGVSRICEVMFPLVVVAGSLYESFLGEDGDINLKKTGVCNLLWRNPVVGHPHTIMTLLEESCLRAYLDEAKASFRHVLENHSDKVLEAYGLSL